MGLKIEGFEQHDVDGGTITGQAQSITGQAGDVENFHASLESSHNTATSGVAGTLTSILEGADSPTKNAGRDLIQQIMSGGGTVRQFGGHVQDFDSTVAMLNIQIGSEETVKEQREKKTSLQGRYTTASERLETQAQAAARQLRNPLDAATITALYSAGALPSTSPSIFANVVPDLAETVPTELPSDLADMTDEERLEHIRSHPDFDPALIPLMPVTTQTVAGEQVANEIEDHELDLQTVQLMNLFGKQDPFAATVYRNVTPDELADTIKALSDDVFPNGAINAGVNPGGATETVDEGQREFFTSFLTAAGTTLATYSRSADPLWKASQEYGHSWGSAVTDEHNPENAGALGMVLRYGGADEDGYGEKFLSDAADDIYTYERGKDGDPVWGPRGPIVMDPGTLIGNGDDHYLGIQHNDALSDVLGAMEHSPEAAQQFFADGFPDEDGDDRPDLDQENERLDYLLNDRTFARDVAGTRAGDEGDGLGKALAAVSIGNRVDEPITGPKDDPVYRDELSATIASQTLTAIGERSGTEGAGPGGAWHAWPEMTDDLGKIVGGYMANVYDVMNRNSPEGSSANPWVSDGPHVGLHLGNSDKSDEDILRKVLGEIGRTEDRTGLETVVASAVIEGNNRLGGEMDDYLGDPDKPDLPRTMDALSTSPLASRLGGIGGDNGEVLRSILDAGIAGGEDRIVEETERKEMLGKVLGAATSLVPTPQGQIAGALTSQGMSLLTEQLSQAPEPADAGTALADTIGRQSEFGLYTELMQRGFLVDTDGGGVPNGLTTGEGENRVFKPEVTSAAGPDRLPEDLEDHEKDTISAAWDAWYQSGDANISADLASSVLNGFDRAYRD